MSVNHLSKEIVITIVFVCGDEEQAHHVASYIHAKVGQGELVVRALGRVHTEQMNFLPSGLGTAGAHHFHRAIRDGLKSSTPRAEQLRLQPNSPQRVVHNSIRNRSRTLNRAAAAAASK